MIRKIQENDIPRVAEIGVFGWRSAYRGILSDDYLFNNLTVAKNLDIWKDRIKNPAFETYVYDDGIVKAFMTIGKCGDKDKPESFEIGAIYVEPLMKRQGIGNKLVKFCEKRAKEHNYSEIVIWVFKDNAPSRKFYEAMGYSLEGAEKKELRHGGALQVRYIKKLK